MDRSVARRCCARFLARAACAVGVFVAVPATPQVIAGPAFDAADQPSLSVGDSEHGALKGGVEMPRRAPGLWRLSVVSQRGTGWATRGLVELLVRVSGTLQRGAEHAGTAVRIGNLSLLEGGEMRWSHSHRSGRDADILLYLTDVDGKPLSPDEFVAVDSSGRGRWKRTPVVFDAARTWDLVRALLTDSHVQVQHLYLAEPLRQQLLSRARAIGEPEWVVQRARTVLHEPGHAGRHDDHLHLRIYCSRADRLAGCSDDDPRWPWVQGWDHEVRAEVQRVVAELGEPDVGRRAAAIEKLKWFQKESRAAVEALTWAAAREVAELRSVAREALAFMAAPSAWPLLMEQARAAADGQIVRDLTATALQVARPEHGAEVLALLGPDVGELGATLDGDARSELRTAAVRAVRPWLLEESAEPLVDVLDDASPSARRAALQTLEHLANRPFPDATAARTWLARDGSRGRWQWMVRGFALRGLRALDRPEQAVPRLVAQLTARQPLAAANAEAMLRHVLGRGPGALDATALRKHRAWARWWDVHRRQFVWSEGADDPEPDADVDARRSVTPEPAGAASGPAAAGQQP